MNTFTLDTNCVIAVDDGRPEAKDIRSLVAAHDAGEADVAVVAISASERQQAGSYLHNFAEFQRRLESLGMGKLRILAPMAYFDITFLDWCLLTDAKMETLESEIHKILFPQIDFLWFDHCAKHGIATSELPSGRWRNAKCDVQAIWCHIYNGRDVFVTSDTNFHSEKKKAALVALGAKQIATSAQAVSLLGK